MWSALLLAILSLVSPSVAHTSELTWQACRGTFGADGPRLSDCRPYPGPIDPQGRELWLRAAPPAPRDKKPRALYVSGVVASEAWLNSRRLGANGRPAATAAGEVPGLYDGVIPIPAPLWRPNRNELIVRLSSFHGGLRLAQPIGRLAVEPYPPPSRSVALALTSAASGALIAGAFGFGVVHVLRRTGSSLLLAALCAVAAVQVLVENLRILAPYLYPAHTLRLAAIWLLAATYGLLLVSFVTSRYASARRSTLILLAAAGVAATLLVPTFDGRTIAAIMVAAVVSLIAVLPGLRDLRPGARMTAAYLGAILAAAVTSPAALLDLSSSLLAAGLLLPLLMAEVVRIGLNQEAREAALAEAARQPDWIAVASSRGAELVLISDIVSILGADDYVELRLLDGRALLHADRLDRLERVLPSNFVRTHRSSIANMDHAQRLERDKERWRVRTRDGQLLRVSRSRLAHLRQRL